MWIYIYTCIYIYTYIYIYMYLYVHIYMYTYMCIYVYMYILVNAYDENMIMRTHAYIISQTSQISDMYIRICI